MLPGLLRSLPGAGHLPRSPRCLSASLLHALPSLRRLTTCLLHTLTSRPCSLPSAGHLPRGLRCLSASLPHALPGLRRLTPGIIQPTSSLLPGLRASRAQRRQRLLRSARAGLQLGQVKCGLYGDFEV